jgi:N-acetylmuramic acid 6-phosphate etherase
MESQVIEISFTFAAMLVTESASRFDNLENQSLEQLLAAMNELDHTVPAAVSAALPQLTQLAEAVFNQMAAGGRLIYVGAGTSGRLGVLDAAECIPTFGIPTGKVIGIIAGGELALRQPVEGAEDDREAGANQMRALEIQSNDCVIGISASGRTPYVVGALTAARQAQALTGCIVCNTDTIIAQHAAFPVVIITGPEFIRGSTRLKAGTAQKLALNMLSTSVMIRLGHIQGNEMIDMQLTNEKLINRALRIITEKTGLDITAARKLLLATGSVRKALESLS